MSAVRLAMAQINPTVGALSANSKLIVEAAKKAFEAGCELVVFPELALSGYPIEDLALSPDFLETADRELSKLATALKEAGMAKLKVVLGHPSKSNNPTSWAIGHNSVSVITEGEVTTTYHKQHLPNYSVFDEFRVFVPGVDLAPYEVSGLKFTNLICEDIWQESGPIEQVANLKPDIAIVINGSPFEISKENSRLDLVRKLATKAGCGAVYVNLIGGQDDLVFDGGSFAVSSSGELVLKMSQFVEAMAILEVTEGGYIRAVSESSIERGNLDQIWNALVLGLKDYVEKNSFASVVLGLSGGIDSAVCAAIAADAIGGRRVFGISMPSPYSSEHSKADAASLAKNLGIQISTQPIDVFLHSFTKELSPTPIALENLQARIRALILMTESNKSGHLVLSTGNKTEIAVGYSTIYGDSVGGFAPLKDVEKTLVWELARYRNQLSISRGELPPIPESSITKPPSAELRPDQTDQDSLPEYETLDGVLRLFIEERKSIKEIIAAGYSAQTVEEVLGLVKKAEWKRRQGAIGPRITRLAFGRERRIPITNKFNEESFD